MTLVRATLKRGTESPSFGEPVSLDAAGLDVVLDIPPGVELDRAELCVEAPDDTVEIDLGPAAAITTSAGALDASKPVDWVSLDWGARRPLTSLHVDSQAKRGRLKVAEGGPWFPPLPFEIIDLNREVRLSGVTATRLLVEPLNDNNEQAPAAIKGIKARAAARPPDISASIAAGAPFFQHPLLLGPGETLALRDELTAALRRAWPPDLAGGKVTVTLRSSAESRLHSVRLTLATHAVIQTWRGGADSVALSIPPGGSAEAHIDIAGDRPLESLCFTVESKPRPEAVPLLPKPRTDPLVAHLAGAGFGAAQAFSTPDEGASLAGIDLYLQPLTPIIKGTVTIHPDAFGRPADAPFDGAMTEVAIEQDGSAPWPARWVSLDFPGPVPVQDQVFWAVLDVSQGECLWLLGEAPDADPRTETAPRGALFRAGGDRVWRERDPPPVHITQMPHPCAYARPRLRADTPPPAPEITLRRGKTGKVSAPIGDGGRVALDARALSTLMAPKDGDTPLRVIVRSAVAAEVILGDLAVSVPSTQEYP